MHILSVNDIYNVQGGIGPEEPIMLSPVITGFLWGTALSAGVIGAYAANQWVTGAALERVVIGLIGFYGGFAVGTTLIVTGIIGLTCLADYLLTDTCNL